MKSYRPISLLCIISKILERIAYDKIICLQSHFLTSVWFQAESLHFSTVAYLFELYIRVLGSTTQTDVIYLDFKKAFDGASYNELLLNFGLLVSKGIFGNGLEFTSLQECSV